jgi:hypothetical protein
MKGTALPDSVARLLMVISMRTTTSWPCTPGSWMNWAWAQLSMSMVVRVTGRKLPRSTRIAF